MSRFRTVLELVSFAVMLALAAWPVRQQAAAARG